MARQPCPNPDLTLGRSGVLLAAALLLDTLKDDPSPPLTLTELGEELLAGIWEEIDALPPIAGCAERPNLGMAHGWAGYLYATLQWCRAAARPLPPRLDERLMELAGCARPRGRGLCWPWYGESGTDHGTMPGWCNGSAGFVFLWTLAHRQLGDPAFHALAEGAAWNAWEDPRRPRQPLLRLRRPRLRPAQFLQAWGRGRVARPRPRPRRAGRPDLRAGRHGDAPRPVLGRGRRGGPRRRPGAARGGGVPVLRGGGVVTADPSIVFSHGL